MLDAIIVGAGPAGLFASIRLSELLGSGRGILVLEKTARPGQKLLASGSGQCNLSHSGPIGDFLTHYGDKGRFMKPALYSFDNMALVGFLEARGLGIEEEAGSGKLFPSSRKASDVLSVLLDACKEREVKVLTCAGAASVSRIGLAGEPAGFSVGDSSDAAAHEARNVVIACGGMSYPRTGSCGDGYALAASLGHGIVEPGPALSPVIVRGFELSCLSGLSFSPACMSLWREGRKILERSGDLLITHRGLSGPLVLDSSRWIRAGDVVKANFASGESENVLEARLDAAISENPKTLARGLLHRLGLPKSLSNRLAELAGIGEGDTCAGLPRAARKALGSLAAAFPARVEALGGFDEAMVTRGGVDCCEIDPKTMESRLCPGLYFAGEVMDLDGDSGGYNLQAAFSTGALAAAGIARKRT